MKKLLYSLILISTLLIGLNPVTWAFPPVMPSSSLGYITDITDSTSTTSSTTAASATAVKAVQDAQALKLPLTGGSIGTTAAGGNLVVNATLGTELITAPMVTGGWTMTDGWSITAGTLSRAGGTTTGTATAVSGMTSAATAGVTYKVVIVCSAAANSPTYTLGGVTGTTITAATITNYITAATTAKIIFSGGSTATATITSVSVKALTDATGDVTVYGNLKVGSPIQNIAGTDVIIIGPTGDVGIGRTDPAVKLDVTGEIRASSNVWASAVQSNAVASNSSNLTVSSGGANDIIFRTNGTTEYMRLKNGGNLGIGTAAPAGPLHINYAPTASANYGTLSIGSGAFNGSTSGYFVGSASGTSIAVNEVTGYAGNLLDLQVNGSYKMKLSATGALTLSQNIYVPTIYGINGTSTLNIRPRFTATSAGVGTNFDFEAAKTNSTALTTLVALTPVYNQTGDAANTDLKINRTETALGSGAQYLIDAGTGGGTYVSKFSVSNTGAVIGASFTAAKASGVAGLMSVYEANSTDTSYIGTMGPASISESFSFQYSNTQPAAGQAMVYAAPTGTGDPNGQKVSAQTWVTPINKTQTFNNCTTVKALVDTDDFPVAIFPYAVTITGVRIYHIGSTEMVGQFDECTGSAGTCTTLTTVDADITASSASVWTSDDASLTNPTIAANNGIWWHTTSVTGTNTFATMCFNYTID